MPDILYSRNSLCLILSDNLDNTQYNQTKKIVDDYAEYRDFLGLLFVLNYNSKITIKYLTEEYIPTHNLYLYNRESKEILDTVSDIIVCVTSKDRDLVKRVKSLTDRKIVFFVL